MIEEETLQDLEVRLYSLAALIFVQLRHERELLFTLRCQDSALQCRLKEHICHVDLVCSKIHVGRAIILLGGQLEVTSTVLHLGLLAVEPDLEHLLALDLVNLARLLEYIFFGVGRLLCVQVVLRYRLPYGNTIDDISMVVGRVVERNTLKRGGCLNVIFSCALHFSYLRPEKLILCIQKISRIKMMMGILTAFSRG